MNGEYYIMKHFIGIEKSKNPWWLENVNLYEETRNDADFWGETSSRSATW
jgi:aspartyl/asparaginyl beta-hydroxylase (cupin superfamily)